jgi:transglutaminase-like putative cysteine protease
VFGLLTAAAAAEELEVERTPAGGELIDALSVTTQVKATAVITVTGSGRGDELRANLYYTPTDPTEIVTIPEPVQNDPLQFVWRNVREGRYTFQYDALVTSGADRVRISEPIQYPFTVPQEQSRYLLHQEYTDTNPQIRALASQLAAGETDAARVVHKIAQWTRTNIEYNLTSIAADATQKASWVYENRYGVCDEMTALFISLSREAGIPARFVSGLAYTTLPEFPEPWQAHGWAEVWLPRYGWVPVDVTYGEVFWLDAVHIPMLRTADARSTAADYSLRARDLTLQPGVLDTEVAVLETQGSVREPLTARVEAQYRTTGSASGNVIIATITNDAPYVVATDVSLAATKDTIVYEDRTQMVFLPPKATRLVRWRVTMPQYEQGYEYTVPFGVFVQRAGNATTSVSGNTKGTVYTLPPPEQTANQLLAGGLAVQCEAAPELFVGENATVVCTSQGARVCANSCSENQAALTFTATNPGVYPIRVNASSGSQRGHALVTFAVLDKPAARVVANLSPIVNMDSLVTLSLAVNATPLTDAVVTVSGALVQHEWELETLTSREFALQFPAALLKAGANELTITVTGLDKNGERFTHTQVVAATLPATLLERIKLFFLHLFG